MNSEEQKIIDIKVKYEDAIYGIVRFQEKLQDLKNTQQKLDEQFKNGEITYNEYTLQTEAAKNATNQYKENIRVLRKEIQNNLRTEQEQDGSLKSLRAQLSNATKAYDELSRAERQGAKGQELVNHINQITEELKQAEQETQRFYRNVGNYYNSMYDALADVQNSEFMRVDGPLGDAIDMTVQLGQAAERAGTKIKAFGKSLMALMTNPVFLTIAGIVGTGMAFKFWYDYNKGLEEASRLTTEFTGLTGTQMQAVRNEILATASAMGAEFKDTLATVDFLMAQYGMDAQEALKVVQDGFAAGADLSGDMLSKMQKYAPAFKDMGLEASQMAAIMAQTRSGIFTDDGLTAIQMAGKKLREMSDTTAKSLQAVGIDAVQLGKDMETGAITGFEAVQKVSGALAKVGTNSKEAGAVLLNVFGRQGAAAGQELLKSIATMSTNIEEVKKQTGEWGEQQQQLIDAQTELKNVTSALFDVTYNGFEEFMTQAKIIATQTLGDLMKGVVKLANYFVDLYNKSTAFRGAMELIAAAFKVVWAVASGVFKLIGEGFKGIGRQAKAFLGILEGVMTLDLETTRRAFNDMFTGFGKTLSNQIGDFKELGQDLWKSVRDGWNNTVNGNELKKVEIPVLLPSERTKSQSGTTGGQTGKNGAERTETSKTTAKKSDDASKLEAQRLKEREKELQMAILRLQMQYQDKMIRAKQMYLAGFYEDEKQYQSDIEELQKEEVARMLDIYVKAGAIGEQKAQEMQVKLLDMQIKFNEQLKAAAAKLAEQWRTEFEAQETERERQLIAQGILEDADNEARLERYKAFLEAKKQAYKDNAAALEEIDKESKDTEEKKEEESYEKKKSLLEKNKNTATDIANQITSGFSSAFAAMFAEQEVSFKAFMKSILITTIDAIEKALLAYEASILAKEIASKSWAGVASAAALTALITAAFEAAKAGVNSFAVGGLVTGAGTATSDSIPARLSNGESVMTARATSMFSPLLSTFNQLGGGVPIVVNGGGASSIGEDFLAAAVAKGFMMCPAPVVSVEEINRVASRVKVIQTRGTI